MRRDPEYAPEGYCDSCGLPCIGVEHDEGIGAYEYFGSQGFHHDYVYRSNCCSALVLDSSPVCTECGKKEVYDCGLCFNCYVEEGAKC